MIRFNRRTRVPQRARYRQFLVEGLESRTLLNALIPVANHSSIIYDNARERLYITTHAGMVERYDLATKSLLSPWTVGTALSGGDISLDQNTLYLTSTTVGKFHRIDLTTGNLTTVTGPQAGYAAAMADNTVLLSGGGGLHRYDPAGGSFTSLSGDGYLVRNAAHTHAAVVGFGGDSFKRYSAGVLSGAVALNNVGTVHLATNLSPDGTRLAIAHQTLSQFSTVEVVNGSGGSLQTMLGTGAIYDPVRPRLYVAEGSEIQVRDFETLSMLGTWNLGEAYTRSFQPDMNGLMRISDDGSKLFVQTVSGVRFLDLNFDFKATISPVTTSGWGAAGGFTVTMTHADGTPAPDYRGTIRFLSSDAQVTLPADYTFTAGDAGAHTFSFTPGAPGNFTLSVTDTQSSEVGHSREYTVGKRSAPLLVTGDAVGGRLMVTVNFNLSGIPAGFVPTGKVQIRSGGVTGGVIGTGDLSGGFVTISTDLFPPENKIGVVYLGDGRFSVQEVSGTLTVAPQATITTISPSAANIAMGGPLSLTAVVSDSGSNPVQWGTVTFQVIDAGGGVYWSGSTALLNASVPGVATINVPALPPGAWKVKALYTPHLYYAASGSPLAAVTVGKATPTATVTVFNGQLRAVVTGVPEFVPAGNVVFREGNNVLGILALGSTGYVDFSPKTLSPSNHQIYVSYEGSSVYTGANSSVLNVVVSAPPPVVVPTATALQISTLAPAAGRSVQLTATVSPAATGTVTFFDGGTALGTATLANGSGSISVSFAAGSRSIVAKYTPTGQYQASTSAAVQVLVSTPTVVDLLAVYAGETLTRMGSTAGVLSKLQQMIDDTNTAFANSGILLTLRLAALSQVSYTESGRMATDLTRLATPGDGYLDTVPGHRDVVGADLVVLLDSKPTPSEDRAGFITSGISYTLLDPKHRDRAEVAYMVIDLTAARGDYLLAHEVAHSFGATHAAGDGGHEGVPYAHGYRFTGNDGVQYRDIMAYDPGTLIPYFSNPGITYKGKPIGDPATANAARLIAEQAPLIANYRSAKVLGGLDVATNSTVGGWFFDPRAFGGALTVRVDIDGVTRATFAAGTQRQDLYSAFGSMNHGFTYVLPPLAAGQHAVHVYVQDATGAHVLVGSKVVTAVTPLFEEAYYLATNPDIAAAVKAGAIASGYDHFQKSGQFERRNPSAWFDAAYYLQRNGDLAAAAGKGQLPSPFAHYLAAGQFEGRLASPYFDERFYRLANPDIAAAIKNGGLKTGLEHFLLQGQFEGRTGLPYFVPAHYRASNPGVPADQMRSPMGHFLSTGNAAGASPSTYFDQPTYLAKNPDIAAAVANKQFVSGLDHYLRFGRAQGRSFSNAFSEASYLAKNGDIAAAVKAGIFSCGFEHWLLAGRFENRQV